MDEQYFETKLSLRQEKNRGTYASGIFISPGAQESGPNGQKEYIGSGQRAEVRLDACAQSCNHYRELAARYEQGGPGRATRTAL
jgi:hypothetical protein